MIAYIEKLLKGHPVVWKTLGEIAKIKRGERVTKSQLMPQGEYPVISGGVKPLGFFDRANRSRKTITIAQYGSAGYVDWQSRAFWANDVCYSIFPHSYIYKRFLYHVLLSKQSIIYSLITEAIPAYLPLYKLVSISIPIPPLPIQVEIARILDSFMELEARRKQYEFYRNSLLSFDKPGGGGKIMYKSLGEVGTFVRGSGLPKKDFTESGVGCIHYGQIYTVYGLYTKSTLNFCSEETAHKLIRVQKGDLIIACTSENIEDVCKAVVWLGENEIVTGGHTYVYKHNQNAKYIAYYFTTEAFSREKKRYAQGTKVIDCKASDLARISIPIPPLHVQEEIVRILDKFDTLTYSLTEGLPLEIELRRKQYEYYREQLLSFPKN